MPILVTASMWTMPGDIPATGRRESTSQHCHSEKNDLANSIVTNDCKATLEL
jgi:hypothetical protein